MDWVEVTGLLCIALGQPPSVVDEELFPDIVDLLAYLRETPPVHVMLAQFFEVKAGTKKRTPSSREEFMEWAKQLEN